MIKIYIQSALLNIFKTGSKQIEQMSFTFFFVYIDIQSERKSLFPVIG